MKGRIIKKLTLLIVGYVVLSTIAVALIYFGRSSSSLVLGMALLFLSCFGIAIKMALICLPKTSPQEIAILQTMERLRGLPYEVQVIIGQDGENVGEYTQYSSKRVTVPDESIAKLQAKSGTISIHNHDTDTPPSISDLAFAARCSFKTLIVISPNFDYIIAPGPAGWRPDSEVEKVLNKYLYLFKVTTLQRQRTIGHDKNGIFVEESEELEVESTDQAIRAVTRELGYDYVCRPYQKEKVRNEHYAD